MSDVTFHNIRARMAGLEANYQSHTTLELIGFDIVHAVEGVFRRCSVGWE